MHKEELIKFGSHLLPDPGIFGRILQFGSYIWTKWSDLHENFTTNVTLNKEVPVKFWKLSGSGLHIRTPDPDHILLSGGMQSLTSCVSNRKMLTESCTLIDDMQLALVSSLSSAFDIIKCYDWKTSGMKRLQRLHPVHYFFSVLFIMNVSFSKVPK